MAVTVTPQSSSSCLVERLCHGCHKMIGTAMPVSDTRINQWLRTKARPLVQEAFPELTDSQREVLLTGYCAPCWDRLWAETDDDAPPAPVGELMPEPENERLEPDNYLDDGDALASAGRGTDEDYGGER